MFFIKREYEEVFEVYFRDVPKVFVYKQKVRLDPFRSKIKRKVLWLLDYLLASLQL